MTNLSGKLPFVQNQAQAIDWRNAAQGQEMGWELPCTVLAVSNDGLKVTLNFEMNEQPYQLPQITVPIFMSEYVRLPIQPGTRGYTRFVDVPTDNITAEKSSSTTFKNFGNLNKTLVFQPISNAGWLPIPNQRVLWLYGPEGVTIQDLHLDENGAPVTSSVVTISQTVIRLQSGTSFIQINKDGMIDIQGASVRIMGKDFLTHHHSGVQAGSDNTGNVT